MKPPSKVPKRFVKKSSEEAQSQKRYLFFSDRASRTNGYHVASLNKGKKEIRYTGISSDPNGPEHKWPDRELVWEGLASEMKFERIEKPWIAQRRYIPFSTSTNHHQPQGEMR